MFESGFSGNRKLRLFFELLFVLLNLAFLVGAGRKWFFMKMETVSIASWTDGEGKVQSRPGHSNFLVVGFDADDKVIRTDTILLIGANPGEKKVSILSIPRDTRVIIGGRARKINEILQRHGEDALRSLIEDLLSIRIKRMARVDFQGFVNIIDIIGGVEVYIERPMHYDDYFGKVHIHFDKGNRHLNGSEALNYVRFRSDAMADLARIKRQQQFVRLVANRLLEARNIVRLPQIIRQAISHVETDFQVAELVEFIYAFKDGNVSVETMSLPGETRYINKVSYFLPYSEESVAIGAKHFADLVLLELNATFTHDVAVP